MAKKFLLINRRAPYGTIYALESLEVVLIAAAFEQEVALAFLDDGVYQLKSGMQTQGIETKNFSPIYRALEDYDIDRIFVDADSLRSRGLAAEDLIVPVQVIERAAMSELMRQQDVVLSF